MADIDIHGTIAGDKEDTSEPCRSNDYSVSLNKKLVEGNGLNFDDNSTDSIELSDDDSEVEQNNGNNWQNNERVMDKGTMDTIGMPLVEVGDTSIRETIRSSREMSKSMEEINTRCEESVTSSVELSSSSYEIIISDLDDGEENDSTLYRSILTDNDELLSDLYASNSDSYDSDSNRSLIPPKAYGEVEEIHEDSNQVVLGNDVAENEFDSFTGIKKSSENNSINEETVDSTFAVHHISSPSTNRKEDLSNSKQQECGTNVNHITDGMKELLQFEKSNDMEDESKGKSEHDQTESPEWSSEQPLQLRSPYHTFKDEDFPTIIRQSPGGASSMSFFSAGPENTSAIPHYQNVNFNYFKL